MKKKIAIVSVTNDLYTDQRVHKVCTYLEAKNYNVILVGRRLENSQDLDRSYQTKRFKLRYNKGPKFYANYNLRLLFYLLFKQFDLLVSNDLDTLLANFIAFRLKGGHLVYDTHELYTEVPELVNRPKVQNTWKSIEKAIFPQLKNIITVNQSIADIYNKWYNKPITVVRNIGPRWIKGDIATKAELNIPENQKLLIIQGAGINVHRGAEEAILAMKNINAFLMIVGSGDVINELKTMVKEHQLEGKVRFYGKRPYKELMQFTAHADLGLTLDKANNLNYQFSLPNKVFDYIQAKTPIIASNVVEVKRIVEDYQVGKIVHEVTPEAISKTINQLLDDPAELLKLKANCLEAANELNWENETKNLDKIYDHLK